MAQDEADILGDRIAIMAEGKLQCVGSALFLKGAYGVGYTLTIVKQRRDTRGADGERKDADDSHSSSVGAAGVVAEHTALLTSTVTRFVPVAEPLSIVGAEQSFRLPFSASATLADLFQELDSRRTDLGVAEYGISVTTLEEVFMRVGHGEEEEHAAPVDKAEPVEKIKDVDDGTRKSSMDLMMVNPAAQDGS